MTDPAALRQVIVARLSRVIDPETGVDVMHMRLIEDLTVDEGGRMVAQVLLGTAALALQTELTIEQIKSLTPMQTVDEAALAQLSFAAARTAKEKTDALQRKQWPEETETR
jgi:metal-sulfur cluster biosynthetic enzyme